MNLFAQAISLEKQAATADISTFDTNTLRGTMNTDAALGAAGSTIGALAFLLSKGKIKPRLQGLLAGEKGGVLNLLKHTPREVSRAVRAGGEGNLAKILGGSAAGGLVGGFGVGGLAYWLKKHVFNKQPNA